ncbi:MAG: 3-oxoacyl-[acyl-carrier-protein] reductase [Dehalococcoidia bacterium]|nr:3-oxoacyl-[acyl-carrier-protein] reductase [Dehalococcoidia bacterium]
MTPSLSDKVALVTGSTQGIGKGIALKFASMGAIVVVHGSRPSTAVVQEITSAGGKASYLQADLSQASKASELVDKVVEAHGSIDILVNNAGINKEASILRMSDADWDEVMNINLKAAFVTSRTAVKHMLRKRWGRIINMSSVIGEMGNAWQANYAAAKAGMLGLTKSTAMEVATRNITVNAIAAGFIETDMTKKVPEAMRLEILKRIPAGRFGTTEEVANLAAFLASEESSYITGQVLRIDGGMLRA